MCFFVSIAQLSMSTDQSLQNVDYLHIQRLVHRKKMNKWAIYKFYAKKKMVEKRQINISRENRNILYRLEYGWYFWSTTHRYTIKKKKHNIN